MQIPAHLHHNTQTTHIYSALQAQPDLASLVCIVRMIQIGLMEDDTPQDFVGFNIKKLMGFLRPLTGHLYDTGCKKKHYRYVFTLI